MEVKEITELGKSLSASYDLRLVFLSLVIAVFGSYTALDLAGQVIFAKKLVRKYWLIGSALALGISIWVMHFIAMLAYQLPIPITYNFSIVLISVVVAIVGAGIGLFLVSQVPLGWQLLGSGGFFVGLAIIGMHYTAMQAMLLAAEPKHNIQLVILADIWAIIPSLAALWLTFHPSAKTIVPNDFIRKIGSATIAGAAIDGMHYIAMAAVNFYPSVKKLRVASSGIDNYVLAITIGAAAVIIMLLALLASFFGQRLSAEIARAEALRESEKKYQNLYDLAPDAYITITADGTIESANQFFADSLGYSKEELIGKSTWGIIYEDDREWARQWVDSIFQQKLPTSEAELRKVRKDGSVFWIVQRSKLLLDDSGRAIELNIICRDITQRKQMEEQLLQNALHDALTGLPNRVLFMERLGLALSHAKRQQDYLFAVLFLDLDRFKVVNDSLGHLQGDELLKAIATRLRSCLRPMDTVARLGGDEFTILVEDIEDASDAIRVAERVQAELSLPFTLGGQEIFTSASIGIALSTTDYDNPEALLRDADIAMYQAKSQGSARYQIFNQDMYARAVALLQLETDLRNALERQEFRLQYQPIVSLESGSIKGFEALLRWQHPYNGLLNPNSFIQAAEEAGLIARICEWVLCVACSQLRQWQLQLPTASSLSMSVNLSGKQFNQPLLSDRVKQILQDTGLDAASLRLEITEGAIMDGAEFAAEILQQLRDIGVKLSIDDFGTGYSSLGRLYHFPIDELKIDRSFVAQMQMSSGNSYIVETIVTLAHKLGLFVTAEGVETASQLAQLRALECEYAQGNFFSQPLDSEAAEALLRENPQW
ncbi:MAG TPA: bifunctional diguanylate cyclase/phosphodiesterase [Cyanobacteria bacterium UBA11049]|nr:bifunctional diguanylate cyclase/phosphodiesterase [Cyanobacteria bacterium UBA11049]